MPGFARPYQRLRNSLLSSLNDDTDSLFHHLKEKKSNKVKRLKEALLKILSNVGGEVSFYEIVKHLIKRGDIETLNELVLGDKVSSSKKAILAGYDCCLFCKKDHQCTKRLLAISHKDRVNYLLYLRFVKAVDVLRALKWGVDAACFSLLIKEPIILKYVANYSLVVDLKNELKRNGMIGVTKTLYKGAGKYCPFEDTYRLPSSS